MQASSTSIGTAGLAARQVAAKSEARRVGGRAMLVRETVSAQGPSEVDFFKRHVHGGSAQYFTKYELSVEVRGRESVVSSKPLSNS